MKKNIAYLVEYPTVSGGEKSLIELLKHLDRDCYHPVVFVPENSGLLPILLSLESTCKIYDPAKTEKMLQLLHEGDYSLVHANSLSMTCKSAALSESLGIPVIGHIRDIAKLSKNKILLLNTTHKLIAVSSQVKKHFVSSGIFPEKIKVIFNSVDTGIFDPQKYTKGILRKEFGLSDGDFLIGCIGQICLRKAQDVFISTAEEIAKSYPQARFIIVGERFSQKVESIEFEKELHERCSNGILQDRSFFTGYRNDMPELYVDLDCLIHPSHQDPLSRVLLEASAMKVPIIATDVGGTSEIIKDNETGFLVDENSISQMVEKFEYIRNNKEKVRKIIACARETMEDKFSSRVMTEVMNLYDAV